jgi:hypothetical protein
VNEVGETQLCLGYRALVLGWLFHAVLRGATTPADRRRVPRERASSARAIVPTGSRLRGTAIYRDTLAVLDETIGQGPLEGHLVVPQEHPEPLPTR